MKANELQEQWSFLHATLHGKACAVLSLLEGEAIDCRTLMAVMLIAARTENTLLFAHRVQCY